MTTEQDFAYSSITIKEIGEVKSNGKTIKQEFTTKIYTNKLGVEAERELRGVKQRWEDKIPEKDYPPQSFDSKSI